MFVDGLVKATDEHSTKSVMFAAIRPFEIKPGGWMRGYVRRRYLALVSILNYFHCVIDDTFASKL